MTWLVVGASGQLGQCVCDLLAESGIVFRTWDREQGSIGVKNFVDSYVGQIQPKVIVNCAAWTDVDGAEDHVEAARLVNAEAVGNLASASKRVGAKFMQVSTDYDFPGNGDTPWPESGVKNPLSAYGRTKAEGEDKVLEIFPEGSYIFRTAWLYSEYGKNFAKTMVRMAFKDEGDVSVVDDQVGQPTYARDLAAQIVDAVVAGIEPGVYHGTNGGQGSWFEFAQEIFRLAGADVARVKPVGSEFYVRKAKRPSYSVLGHDEWVGSGVEEMRDWKIALAEAMPAIVSAVKAEG
jgi:dTDP-4-dehydrorhamnose reductase